MSMGSTTPPESGFVPSELVERLGVASKGSRELDVLVGSATGYRNRFTGQLLSEALADPEMRDEAMQWEGVPYYTVSLDAAVALAGRVLPGWGWDVASNTRHIKACLDPALGRPCAKHPHWAMMSDGVHGGSFQDGATPALALCIAILKATTANSVGMSEANAPTTPPVKTGEG